MTLDTALKLLEVLACLVAIVGLPLASLRSKQERERDRREIQG